MRPDLWLPGAAVVLVFALAPLPATAQERPFETVTDDVLRSPSDADWLQWRRTYDGWGYSPLDQIDRENVGTLRLAWSRALNPGGR